MFNLLKALTEIDAVSGREDRIREYIIEQIRKYAEIRTDGIGNLIAFKKGAKRPAKKLMLCAHMDEVGLIIHSADSNGFLRFSDVGGIDAKVLPGRKVRIAGGVTGVIGSKPIHLLEEEEKSTSVKIDNLYIDIGASDAEEARKHVSPGDTAVFMTETERFGSGLIKGKALDDRVGCAVLMAMIRRDLPYDMTFVFTVQEELGTRGAGVAAFSVEPDAAIVVETTTAADIVGIEPLKQVCRLHEGAVISFMDHRAVYDTSLYEGAFAAAKEIGVKCQPKTAVAGGNDAGAIQTSRSGVRVLAVSLPCRYLHAPVGVISEYDLDCVQKLVFALSGKIAAGAL